MSQRSPLCSIRASTGTSVCCLVTTFARTMAWSPSIFSSVNFSCSPPNRSIFEMYVCSSSSANSCTNSWRSCGVRCCQCGPSARRAVSCTSKTSEAILRTAARRSGFLSSLLRAGSSSTFTTASVYSRTWSVGAPAHARGLATATRPRATITTADARIMNATPPRRSIPCTPSPRARLPDDGLEVGEDFLLELIEGLAERVAEVGVAILPSLEGLEVGDHAIEAVALDQVVRHEKRELIGGQRAFLEMAHRETAGIAERFEVEPRGHQRGVVANARDGEHAAVGERVEAEALERRECH